jgi:hypothetical protein
MFGMPFMQIAKQLIKRMQILLVHGYCHVNDGSFCLPFTFNDFNFIPSDIVLFQHFVTIGACQSTSQCWEVNMSGVIFLQKSGISLLSKLTSKRNPLRDNSWTRIIVHSKDWKKFQSSEAGGGVFRTSRCDLLKKLMQKGKNRLRK